MQTRKYPRTMEEAFGPYHRGNITEPASKADTIVTLACVIALVCLIAIISIWG